MDCHFLGVLLWLGIIIIIGFKSLVDNGKFTNLKFICIKNYSFCLFYGFNKYYFVRVVAVPKFQFSVGSPFLERVESSDILILSLCSNWAWTFYEDLLWYVPGTLKPKLFLFLMTCIWEMMKNWSIMCWHMTTRMFTESNCTCKLFSIKTTRQFRTKDGKIIGKPTDIKKKEKEWEEPSRELLCVAYRGECKVRCNPVSMRRPLS